jgi:hypothetical protein
MLLGIPLLNVLLVLIGPFVAIAVTALPAAPQWPRRANSAARRPVLAPRRQVFAGGAW